MSIAQRKSHFVFWAVIVAFVAFLADDSFAVTVESYNLNLFRRILDGQWMGIRYATDGRCYFGSSTHSAHHGASFLKYDPNAHNVKMLRADRQLGWQEEHDFHLLSVELTSNVTPRRRDEQRSPPQLREHRLEAFAAPPSSRPNNE